MTKQFSHCHSRETCPFGSGNPNPLSCHSRTSGNPLPPLCHSDEYRNLNSLNVSELLTNPVFFQIQAYGLIDEIALRNLIIKYEYRTLRSKLHLGDAVYELSQKYFLSEYAINNILFRKRTKKPISSPAIKF